MVAEQFFKGFANDANREQERKRDMGKIHISYHITQYHFFEEIFYGVYQIPGLYRFSLGQGIKYRDRHIDILANIGKTPKPASR